MQTGSSETLIGWKSGQTIYVPVYMGPNGGSVAMDSVDSDVPICLSASVLYA